MPARLAIRKASAGAGSRWVRFANFPSAASSLCSGLAEESVLIVGSIRSFPYPIFRPHPLPIESLFSSLLRLSPRLGSHGACTDSKLSDSASSYPKARHKHEAIRPTTSLSVDHAVSDRAPRNTDRDFGADFTHFIVHKIKWNIRLICSGENLAKLLSEIGCRRHDLRPATAALIRPNTFRRPLRN